MTFILPVILTVLTSLAHAADNCTQQVRAVFDVGSGSTKMNVSAVSVCPGKVLVEKILDDKSSLDVALEASKDVKGAISEEGLRAMTAALETLKGKALALAKQANLPGKPQFAAAGTHALRTASNKAEAVKRVESLNIPMTVLTQEQEALAGVGGVNGAKCAAREMLVWDVGGGSQQWTRLSVKPQFAGLPLGAEGFKQKLIEKLNIKHQSECAKGKTTVNPIGEQNFIAAVRLAEKEAAPLPAAFKTGKFCAIGIGGVHTKAVEAQLEKHWDKLKQCVCNEYSCEHEDERYTEKELTCLARFLISKNDCDEAIKGPYSGTSVSNLLMVLGFMRAAKINTINTENVNMGHGLVVDTKLLKFKEQNLP